MGIVRWISNEQAIAQTNTITVGGTPNAGDTYTVTINGKNVTYTATVSDTTNTLVAVGLAAALNACTYGEFAEMSYSPLADVVSATAITAGKPFTQTSSSVGGTLVTATTVANAGPSVLSSTANWSTGVLPADGDDIWIDLATSAPILYELDALSAITASSLNIPTQYAGSLIGLAEINNDSNAPYREYRPTYLAIGATAVNVGYGGGVGLSRMKLDVGSVTTTIKVFATDTPRDPDVAEVFLFKRSYTSNFVSVYQGSFAAAPNADDVAKIATLKVGYETAQDTDAYVRCGPGCTLTTIQKTGGTLIINTACTTLTNVAGNLLIQGTGAITTLTMNAGTVAWRSSGTITTLNLGGTLDSAADIAHTITNSNVITNGATIIDPAGRITWTNATVCASGVYLDAVTLQVGPGRTFKIT